MRAAVLAAASLVALSAAPLAAQDDPSPIRADVQLDVYAAALAFYSPPRGQVRWIEATLLDAGDEVLDPRLHQSLIARLDDRFLPWQEDARGQGGRLRVSSIEVAGPDRYRLTVSYRHRTPWFEGSASTQALLVGCAGGRCVIQARGPGAGADPW